MIETKKAAIYARVSTNQQELNNQLIQLRSYCEKSNYIIYKEYTDIISGKENSRPAYNMMFADAHKKLFDLVLFWDLSRFSRSGTLFTLQKFKELENLGIDWISYQEPFIRSMGQFKDIALSIMATFGKMEREKISERTKAGLANAVNVGKRGKDKKPRRSRSDRGLSRLKRGDRKNSLKSQVEALSVQLFFI